MPIESTASRETGPGGLADLRVAIVHDWLTGMRGGEAVLEVLCDVFPRAEIYTLVHIHGSVSPTIERLPIHASPLMRLPFVRRRYRYYLPLFPWAVGRLDVSEHDLIVSTSHCAAKGIPTRGLRHWCYCHTPMRYVWDRFDDYFGPGRPTLSRFAARLFRRRLQRWDVRTSATVDRFVANSHYVAGRIRRYYDRDAAVIWPPVRAERFRVAPRADVEDFYLIVSALAPYKRIDLAIEACRHAGRRLVIVGKGQDDARLRALARTGDVELRGWQSDDAVADLMSRCRAFVLPGEEDFGITPLEAMAAGRPVIALGQGGALETVVDAQRSTDKAPTGVLFAEPTVDSLVDAIERFEAEIDAFDPEALRAYAETFSTEVFRSRIVEDLERFVG